MRDVQSSPLRCPTVEVTSQNLAQRPVMSALLSCTFTAFLKGSAMKTNFILISLP